MMSSDNLDSGCSTCGSEKSSETDAVAPDMCETTFINLKSKFIQRSSAASSGDDLNSRSSSQESFINKGSANAGDSPSLTVTCHHSNSFSGGKSGSIAGGASERPQPPKSPSSGSAGTPVAHRKSNSNTFKFRLPAVSFFRKKKSWPNLSDDVVNNCLLLDNNASSAAATNGAGASTLSGAYRIKNLTHFSSADCSDPELANCTFSSTTAVAPRHKACRMPSKEDPGPTGSAASHVFYDPSRTTSMTASLTKLKFVREGQIQICRLNHPRTVFGKLTSGKLLRRWESHFLTLDDDEISSKTPVGFMENALRYASMEDVHALPQWDCSGEKFCLRIFVPEGSVLLQTNHVYSRNQWLYSIQWRRNLYRYRRMIEVSCGRPEVLLKETKCMVEHVKCSPLQGDNLNLRCVALICRLFEQIQNGNLPKNMLDPIITCAASLLDTVAAVTEISPWLSKYCNDSPRSRLIDEVLSDVAQQTLKKTMDFGKYPTARVFIQDYLIALSSQNNGLQRVRNFVQSVHGPASSCPHPRVLPNLVSVCLAGIHVLYDETSNIQAQESEKGEKLECYCVVFETISEFDDWRLPLASLLQPVPFPDEVLANETFNVGFARVLRRIGVDSRCEIHLSVLGVRDGKEGWFHLVCPGGPACSDDGELYSLMLKTLLRCCCRRKKFLQNLNSMLGPLQLLALRENDAAMEALCHMLEFDVVEGEDLKLQMITALQSTGDGKKQYAALCDRQIALRELQQKGGPRKLTLPSKSTDADLAVLLSSGSFGNLEWLSLAFTNVTSQCADYLIKLPSLKYLNLWSTQFGDVGLHLLSEHLLKLQVLNLCETPVTDKGLLTLSALKNLRKLNLNSTQLSSKAFLTLKAALPALQEVDVRYTDAWCADEFLQ